MPRTPEKYPVAAAIAEHYAGGTRTGKIHRNRTNRPVKAKRNRQHLVAACGRRINFALGVEDFDPAAYLTTNVCRSCYPPEHFTPTTESSTR